MVQITKGSFEGRGNIPLGGIPKTGLNLQRISDIGAIGGAIASKVSGKIEEAETAANDMEFNKKLTEAQVGFSKIYNERSEQTRLEDGTPAHLSLDTDLQDAGKQLQEAYANTISDTATRDKFNAHFGSFVGNKRIQGFGVARNQQIDIGLEDFSESLDNLSSQASDPNNAVNIPTYINQSNEMIDSAVKNGLIKGAKGVALKKAFSEGAHESVLRQQLFADPLNTLLEMNSKTPKENGISPETQIKLNTVGTTFLKTKRASFSNASDALLKDYKFNTDNAVKPLISNIKNGPGEGDGGVTIQQVQAVQERLINEAQLFSSEQLEAEQDPVNRTKMRSTMIDALAKARDSGLELEQSYLTRNDEVRVLNQKTNKVMRQITSNIPVTESDANAVYNGLDRNNSTIQSRGTFAISTKQKVKPFSSEMTSIISRGNPTEVAEALPIFDEVSTSGSPALDGMGNKDRMKWVMLSALQRTGGTLTGNLETIARIGTEVDSKFIETSQAEFDSRSETGKALREDITDRVISSQEGFFAANLPFIGIDKEEIDPQLLARINTLSRIYYPLSNNDPELTAEAVSSHIASTAGVTSFPTIDENAGGTTLMVHTPEKKLGLTNPKAIKAERDNFTKTMTPFATAAGADPGSMFIGTDSDTLKPGQNATWPVFAKLPSKRTVQLRARYEPTIDDHVEFAATQAITARTKAEGEFGAIQAQGGPVEAYVREVEANSVHPSIRERSNLKAVVSDNIVKATSMTIDSIKKNTPKATPKVPEQATQFLSVPELDFGDVTSDIRDLPGNIAKAAESVYQAMYPRVLGALGKLLTLGDSEAGGGEIPEELRMQMMLADLGEQAANDPIGIRESIDSNLGDSTEAEPDEGINVTGITKFDRQMNAFVTAAQRQHALPQDTIPHAFARKHIDAKLAANELLTANEEEYMDATDAIEEKTGTNNPLQNPLSADTQAVIDKSPVLSRIYTDEGGYWPFSYSIAGRDTVGIGWDLDPSNDAGNTEIINELNANRQGKPKYSLSALRSGNMKLDEKDAVSVFRRFIRASAKETSSHIGDSYSSLSGPQKDVVTNMGYQLGGPTFKEFGLFIKAIRFKDKMNQPKEIINSAAFKQTPQRFARHYVNWINSGRYSEAERKALLAHGIKQAKGNKKVIRIMKGIR